MAGEWNEAPLSDLAELSGGFAFKSGDYALSGRFVLRTLNIADDCSINRNDAVYIPEDLCPAYSRFELKPDDTLFVMVGATLGKVGFVRGKDLPALLNQNMWLIRARPEKACARFVHYAFRHAVKESLGWASGSARDFVRRDDYRNLKIPAPPLPEQRAIAHILGTLDDKIELNRRMNETLEGMARALFQSWFVDFDPVRAKLAGRDPGLPKEIADLFPDRFEDSELGEIPKGWRVERLSAAMTFRGGSQPPSSEFVSEPREGYVRLVQIRDFYSDSHLTYVPDSPRLRKFTTDDVMIARYGSSGNTEKSSDSLARVCRGLSGAYNVALVKMVPNRPWREFLNYFLRSSAFQSAIKGMGARSVQSGFRKEDLDVIPIATGSAQIHAAFERFADLVWRRTYAIVNG
ncbi:MAG: restriction endonuclease subunit S [Deltaproteobacteria bacterium]|nr:restriction endonuclease subunit S [Deltaproteobacteria bacterium]